MPIEFEICTIANSLTQYKGMQQSFIEAGFHESNSKYTLFDNSVANHHDPYQVLSAVLQSTDCKFALFCHQDIRLDKGDGYMQLTERLTELAEKEPAWAVAGNAGVAASGQRFSRITDPTGVYACQALPKTVYTLDENFLLVRSSAAIRTSTTLHGFHLYATDLCFHAMYRGRTCHVIDFHVTHHSAGNAYSDAFDICLSKLKEYWNPLLICGIVETVTGSPLRLSRWQIIRYAMSVPRTERRLRFRHLVFIPCNRLGLMHFVSTIRFISYVIIGLIT